MNRRAFLTGLFGTAAIAAAGPLPAVIENATLDRAQWEEAIIKVWSKYFSDAVIFGRAAIRYTQTFPFVENVPLDEAPWLVTDHSFKGLAQ